MTAQRRVKLYAATIMAEAQANVSAFDAVKAIMEHGSVNMSPTRAQKDRIISTAKIAIRRELRRYDAAQAVLESSK